MFFHIKRFLDIMGSIVGLTVFFPIMAICAIILKLESKGPLFYKQVRVGLNGDLYVLYKLRSMVDNAEAVTGPVITQGKDSRITIVGEILRKYGFDEIPQFFNILKGDMSIVGPRPERPFFVKGNSIYRGLRLKVRPGGTGLELVYWGTSAFSELAVDFSLERKIAIDIYYIKNISIWLDFKIMFKTALLVLTSATDQSIVPDNFEKLSNFKVLV